MLQIRLSCHRTSALVIPQSSCSKTHPWTVKQAFLAPRKISFKLDGGSASSILRKIPSLLRQLLRNYGEGIGCSPSPAYTAHELVRKRPMWRRTAQHKRFSQPCVNDGMKAFSACPGTHAFVIGAFSVPHCAHATRTLPVLLSATPCMRIRQAQWKPGSGDAAGRKGEGVRS